MITDIDIFMTYTLRSPSGEMHKLGGVGWGE